MNKINTNICKICAVPVLTTAVVVGLGSVMGIASQLPIEVGVSADETTSNDNYSVDITSATQFSSEKQVGSGVVSADTEFCGSMENSGTVFDTHGTVLDFTKSEAIFSKSELWSKMPLIKKKTFFQGVYPVIDLSDSKLPMQLQSEPITRILTKSSASEEEQIAETEEQIAETEVTTQKVSNVPNEEPGCKSYCKTYEYYTSITLKASGQWKLLHDYDHISEDPVSHIMKYDDVYYCVAVGTYWVQETKCKIGTTLNITMENGSVIPCILSDIKADEHTDITHRYHSVDGSVVEFVVGTEFTGTEMYPDTFSGKVYRVDITGILGDYEWG